MNQSVHNDYGPSIGKENVLTYDDNEDNQARDDSCNTRYNNQIPEDFIEAFKQNFCGGSTKDSLGDEDTQKNGENIESSEKKTNKRGRKKKTDKTQRKHNKNTPNNIITKIKTHIINTYIISLVKKNSLNRNKKIVLKKLSHKYVKNLNTASNNKLLNRAIKKIFRQSISIKYKNYPPDYNKTTIQKIYDEKDETKKEANIIKKMKKRMIRRKKKKTTKKINNQKIKRKKRYQKIKIKKKKKKKP